MPETSAELVEAITAMSRVFVTDRALRDDLRRLVDVGEQTIPGCDGASIILVLEGHPGAEAATDRVVLELDLLRYEAGDGPYLDTRPKARSVRLDLVGEVGHPDGSADPTGRTGVGSSLSLPVLVDGETVGALNLYSYAAAAFDATSRSIAAVLVTRAGRALGRSRLLAAGRRAADAAQRSADACAEVGVAEGMLMAVEHCTAQQAGALLRNAATAGHSTLPAMARQIIAEVESHGDRPPAV